MKNQVILGRLIQEHQRYDKLRDHSGHSRAEYLHAGERADAKDQHGIQDDIDRKSGRRGKECGPAVPNGGKKAGEGLV